MWGPHHETVKQRTEYLKQLVNDDTLVEFILSITSDMLVINLERDEKVVLNTTKKSASTIKDLIKYIHEKSG